MRVRFSLNGWAKLAPVGLLMMTACTLFLPSPTATTPPTEATAEPQIPQGSATPAPTITTAPTPWPYPFTDERAVMQGICFEAAADAAGQTFVLRDTEAHIRFYDLADNSELCRQPVERYPFDFSDGRILAGLWSAGRGCDARHEITDVQRDDTARTLFIFLDLVVEGDCNYELIQPFWIGLTDVADYEIQFVVD